MDIFYWSITCLYELQLLCEKIYEDNSMEAKKIDIQIWVRTKQTLGKNVRTKKKVTNSRWNLFQQIDIKKEFRERDPKVIKVRIRSKNKIK